MPWQWRNQSGPPPIVNASVDQRWQFSDTTAYFYRADSVNAKRNPEKAQYELRKLGVYTKIYDRRQIDRIFPQILRGDKNPTTSKLMWGNLRREKFNLETSLGAYKGPTLIVTGWQDPIGMSTLYSSLRALPQAEVQGINECGHFASLEQPKKFFGIVNGFLSRHLGEAKAR